MQYKVIHILGTISIGGAELALFNILSNWQDQSFTHNIYYTREYEGVKVRFEDIGITVRPLNWKNEREFYSIPTLIKLFRKERPNIVHTNLWTGNYWVITAAKIAGVPIILESVLAIFQHKKIGNILHKILRPFIFRYIDSEVCASKLIVNNLSRRFGHSRKKFTIIYYGVPNEYHLNAAMLAKLKEELKSDNNKTVLLTIARLVPKIKGYETYLDALRILNERGLTNFDTLIVGGAQKDYPDYPDFLRKKIKEYQLEKNVSLLGYRPEKAELLELSDIFVMPSNYEGGPTTILEAMRAGKPVIATRTGAVPEYVINGETGLIVDPGDSIALANAIEYMLKHPEKWQSMGERGKERFKENFTIDKTVNQLTDLYKSLLSKKGLK